MIKYIDPSGREFDSVRSALRANNKERYMSGAVCKRLKKHGHASIGGMVLTAVDDGQPVKEKITKPQASPLMNKLLSRYSVKELESIARGEGIEKRRMDYPKIILEGEHHRFVVMSDTHIGSIYSPEEWHDIVADYVNNNEIDGIFHLGDLCDGLKISRAGTQIYELSEIGYDAQKKKAIELMSKYNVPIYLISGNHDFYFKEFAGANICKAVSDELDNVIYIGHNSADIEVGGVIVRLFHGGDGNCFTEGTEILTKEGWVDFKDLTLDMEVATMTKDGHCLEWQKPIEITEQEYNGDVYHFKNRKFDFEVTPNHRLWVKYNHNINRPLNHSLMPQKAHMKYDDKWHAYTAEEIAKGWRKQKWVIPTVPKSYKQTDFTEYVDIPRLECKNKGMEKKMYHAGRVAIKDIAELIAWYVTEGHAREKCVTISQYKDVNPEKYERIQSLADRLECHHTDNHKGITFHGKELASYLKSVCGSGSRNKYIPTFIKDNSPEVLRLVLETCIDGDGWRTKRETGQLGYKSISKRLRSDVAEIALKLGYSATFGPDGGVYFTKIQVEPAMVKRPEVRHYEGKVYCCSVPNELIYVRKNGKCFFSHNSYALSYRLQKLIEAITEGKKPDIILAGHVHKYCSIYTRGIHGISAPAMQMQTGFMQAKKLEAHTGFLLLEFDTENYRVRNLTLTYFPFDA